MLALWLTLALGASAQTTAAGVFGVVLGPDGGGVAGAVVTLGGGGPARSATTNGSGRFSLSGVPPGVYTIAASARGYSALSGRTIQVVATGKTTVELSLARAQASSLTVIGQVKANGGQTLSTAPAPNIEIPTQTFAQQGVTRVSDILEQVPSTTVVRVIGGGLNAPASVALRGPDPSETLVDIDGHQVNNGNTGDFDLSLLDPADLQSAQVVYGVAPSALFGPNTLGGAVNVSTLEPTLQPHVLERFTAGSYDSYAETLQATGTDSRLGYAVSYHRTTSGGELDNYALPVTPSGSTGLSTVGNAMDATSTIGKLRYNLPNGGFLGVSVRDQAVYRDISGTLSSVDDSDPSDLQYQSFAGSSVLAHNVAYGFDAQLPLGRANATGIVPTSLLFRHQTSLVSQSVFGPGAATSPFLYNDRDLIGDDTLEFDHMLPKGSLSLKFALTNEALTTDFIPGVTYAASVLRRPFAALREPVEDSSSSSGAAQVPSQVDLGQTQRSVGLRYTLDPTAKLHYSFAAYYSNYSTFGQSVDPRFGFVWTPTGSSTLRFSAGTTFQSPQLPTFIVPPVLPPPVDGYISVGNPNATAERATEYDLGYEHIFRIPGHELHLGADVYRTDLHNGVATYIPPQQCVAGVNYGPNPPCLTYPVNVANEVYQGFEAHGDLALGPRTALHAMYDIDSVYTQAYPLTAADDAVLYEQALGVPLHKFRLTVEHSPNQGLSYQAGVLYEGGYNELNLPAFATLEAGATWHLRAFDIGLFGTNLTNVYDFKLTRIGAGVPYGGLTDTVPTDAYPLAGRQIRLTLTHRS
jgi:outer membrane receptor protein involved in Fe transport